MWPFWFWLVKGIGNRRSKLQVSRNSAFNTLQIQVSCFRRHQEQEVDRGALGSPGPEEGGLGVR